MSSTNQGLNIYFPSIYLLLLWCPPPIIDRLCNNNCSIWTHTVITATNWINGGFKYGQLGWLPKAMAAWRGWMLLLLFYFGERPCCPWQHDRAFFFFLFFWITFAPIFYHPFAGWGHPRFGAGVSALAAAHAQVWGRKGAGILWILLAGVAGDASNTKVVEEGNRRGVYPGHQTYKDRPWTGPCYHSTMEYTVAYAYSSKCIFMFV